jgi:hypothetical protein
MPDLSRKHLTTRRSILTAITTLAAGYSLLGRANAQPNDQPQQYSTPELVDNGHRFFGSISRDLALAVESATSLFGQPNAYILGQEASAAFFGGLRYGEGVMYTRNAGDQRIFWQGPSIGLDTGGDGDRTMMLVYNLPATSAIFNRFAGVDGSAYLVGGFGVTALVVNGMVVVPIRSGIGARLGINISYLKFTPQATWNPF